MAHKCNRDTCKPETNCIKCKSLCYLGCFGFDAGATVNGQETLKAASLDGAAFSVFASCMVFSCCGSVITSTEQTKAMKMPTARSTSRGRPTNEQTMLNDLKAIKEMLTTIQSATEKNTTDIAEIKSLSTKTDANMQKVTESNSENASPALQYHRGFLKRGLEKANGTPNGKRTRSNTPVRETPRPKPNVPASKVGTKQDASGLSVVPKIVRARDDKSKFEKALFVSRLLPTTTADGVVNFVTANTSVNGKERMNVHKLVKKGVDESTLDFVSFKIEVSADDLIILNDPNVWPEGVLVREFVPSAPKNALGRHLPSLAVNDEQQMEVS